MRRLRTAGGIAIGILSALAVVATMCSCPSEDASNQGQTQDAGSEWVPHPEASTDRSDAPMDHDAGPISDSPFETLPPDKAWLADPGAWKAVQGTELLGECRISEAVPDKIGFAKLQWTSCGDGCESADVIQGYGFAYLPVASTAGASDDTAEAYLLVRGGLMTGAGNYQFQRIVRLGDGVSVATLRETGQGPMGWAKCLFGGHPETALAVDILGLNAGDAGTWEFSGHFVPGTASWVWAQPALPQNDYPTARMAFDVDDGPRMFYVGFGVVRARLDPTSSATTLLEPNSASVRGTGQGDLAIWNDFAETGYPRIRGWAPDDAGIRTLVTNLPLETCHMAVTPRLVVGLMGEEVSDWGCNNLFSQARLWRSPRPYSEAQATVTLGPWLPAPGDYLLRSWGDYAALVVAQVELLDGGYKSAGKTYVLVVQLSTWKSWRIDMADGWKLHSHTLAVTGSHLYFGRTLETEKDPKYLHEMLRYDLSKLDQSAVPQ